MENDYLDSNFNPDLLERLMLKKDALDGLGPISAAAPQRLREDIRNSKAALNKFIPNPNHYGSKQKGIKAIQNSAMARYDFPAVLYFRIAL